MSLSERVSESYHFHLYVMLLDTIARDSRYEESKALDHRNQVGYVNSLIRQEIDHQLIFHIGTSSIVDEKTHQPLLSNLSLIVETAAKLRHEGHRVVIVSSGAIGVGLRRMEVEKRPKHLPQVQVRFKLLR